MNLRLMGRERCLKLNKSCFVHMLQVMPISSHIVLSIIFALLEWFKCNTYVVSTYIAHLLITFNLAGDCQYLRCHGMSEMGGWGPWSYKHFAIIIVVMLRYM